MWLWGTSLQPKWHYVHHVPKVPRYRGKKVYHNISSGSCFFGHFQYGRHQNYAKNGENRFFVIVTLKLFQNGCNLVFWRVFYVLLGCHFHFCQKQNLGGQN